MKFRLKPELIQKIPGIQVGAIIIKDVKNTRKSSSVIQLLRGVCAEKKRELAKDEKKQKMMDLLKQMKFDTSVLAEAHLLESNLRKIQRGREIKSLNNALDIAHYLSLKYFVPVLGRDLDQTEKDIEIGFMIPKKGKKAEDLDYTRETKNLVFWLIDMGSQDKNTFNNLPEEYAKIMTKYCSCNPGEVFMLNADQPEVDLHYISEKETLYTEEMILKAAEETERAAKAEAEAKQAALEKSQAAALQPENKSIAETEIPSKPATFEPTVKQQLEDAVSKAVKTLYNVTDFSDPIFTLPVEVGTPKDKKHGDYATGIAMKLAKAVSRTPREMADLIKQNLPPLPYIKDVEFAEPGFLNFTLDQEFLEENLEKILASKKYFGMSNLGEGKKALVEYSSPNIAKPLGAHHLLSTIIGQAIANIMAYCNYETVSLNFPGDWGTQFGRLIYAYKQWGNHDVIDKDPMNELLKLYIRFHDEAEKDPTLEERGREEFKKLEEGDQENRHLWQWIREESIKDLERLYGKLGVHFNEYLGESLYEQASRTILEEGKAKGVFVEGEKGALIVKFENDKYPPCVIQKGDGTTLYATRDLASIKDRLERYLPAKLIYVVDVAQSLYFKQLFATAKKLGYNAAEMIHVVFGRMQLPEGRMSTRKGNVVLLDELLKEAIERAKKIVVEKTRDLSEAEQDFVAEGVGVGAVKYHIVSQNRETNIMFDWGRMLSLEGNSAPYLQYSYARAESILRKAGDLAARHQESVKPQKASGKPQSQTSLFTIEAEKQASKEESQKPFGHPLEQELLHDLVKFPEVVAQAAQTYKPNLICNYLFELSRIFSSFYQEVPVLSATKEDLRVSRLKLVKAFAQVIKNGLHLLGITTFEKM
jgi:arginyl-tRNA synthetase